MDFDQTQAIHDYEEEEEEQVVQDKAQPKKKEAAYLKVFSQQGFVETIFPVFQGDNFIGRDGKCNIAIPIKVLSKKHACIEVQRDLHLIYDFESKNRTKKGKSFLKPTIRYELKHGDMLTFGDVKCQYLVELDTNEDEEDETGSETGSESMLPEVMTEEELDIEKPVTDHQEVSNKSAVKSDVPGEGLLTPAEDSKLSKPFKDDDEAYAADTDSDTDEERPLAAAAIATVLYSSEDEQETPARHLAASTSNKQNSSMDGQTLAFGLGSPDDVFRNRESSGSAASHPGQTGSVPPTLVLSSESDIQSDGKADLSSDNKQTSPKHPGARGSGTQPTCEPTLLYGSEWDDASPVKRPRHPEARVADKQESSCEPTLLYGSESDDGSPVKKPRHPGTSNKPAFLEESDSAEGSDKALKDSDARKEGSQTVNDQTLPHSEIPESSPMESTEERSVDKQEEAGIKDSDATLLYAAAEMGSTDDEEESEVNIEANADNLEKTTAHTKSMLVHNTEESGKEEANDEEDEYGEDSATQPYAANSNFESESEPIPFMAQKTTDKSVASQPVKPADLEATQAYCIEDKDEREGEEEVEGDSDSTDSQPLPIGPSVVGARDDMTATLAYGLEATQAYNIAEKDSDSEDNRGPHDDNVNTYATNAYDMQATQAYGVGVSDDEDDDDKTESRKEPVEERAAKSAESEVNRSDANRPISAYGLEATQAYGADETDDEDSDNQDEGGRNEDEGRGLEATVPYGLAATLPYGGDDSENDGDDDNDDDSRDRRVAEPTVRQENQATLAYGLEETQAYDGDNNDTDSAPHSAIEATQAYGIEEPPEEELQAQEVQYKSTAAKTTNQGGISKATEQYKSTAAKTTNQGGISKATEVAEVDETEVDTSASVEDTKSKPSTSTAVDDEEDLQDSDLIQPRSRSKRGRKKPVIKESQEDGSQQVSERLGPNKGRSRASDKLAKVGSQTEPVLMSFSAGTTEQIEGASGTPEGEVPVSTITTRKGRRGAMRVTIEPEEPEEDEPEEEVSTRRRGRRGAKVTEDQEDDNKKGTSTTGRKRGRQSAKITEIAESSANVSVDVVETPVTKSRRGRRGKTAQTEEAVSVLETPLQTPAVTTSSTEAIDSERPTAMVVETPNVRRGGRGKGRKGGAIKETAQAVEAQDQEESIESQPETVVEATPGRGNRRGKKNQSSTNNELETTELLAPEVSAISDEVQPQLAVATTARGKGRGKGRAKKAQPLAVESEVPETPSVDEEELQAPESPVVAVTAKGKGRGRQGRGKRMQLESSEETSQTLSNAGSREGSQTRKGRGRGKVSRESSEQGPSSDLEVEGTPAKKSRRGKEPTVTHSPSLRQAKHSGENKPRVIFTGLVDKQGEKVVTSLGGELVDDIHSCTHLVTDKVRRTVKFLCGLASGQIIVLPSWLDACKRAKNFVDTTPFLVKDKDAEKQYKFDLQRSHEVALTEGLLEGYKVHVTKKVKPEPSQMKDIIQSAKGEFLSSMPRGKEDRVFVISCEKDRNVCKKPLEAGIPVVSAEVLLTGILRQQLDLEEHKLFAEEISVASQDTTSSSGQSKRRRQPSEAGSSSSTAETKTTGSKRRKR